MWCVGVCVCVCVWCVCVCVGVCVCVCVSSVYAANNLKHINNCRTVQAATRFKTQLFYVLPTQCICGGFFYGSEKNNDYFPV